MKMTKEQKQAALDRMYTRKQQGVLREANKNKDWKLWINYGAVRSGKTIVDNTMFLDELRATAKLAKKRGENNPLYILAGVSSKTIWNNVLNPIMSDFGIDIQFDNYGNFELFGVTVVQAYTGSIAGLGGIRGMTSWGAYINEASLANEEVFNEIRDRCSAGEKRIICDTNPDIPTHWLKKNYIDNPNGSDTIVSHHFILDDNTFLDDDYIKTKKETTPTGMFYDRSILGLWVSGVGAIYRDFDEKLNVVDLNNVPEVDHYAAAVDWGYGHKGVIDVMAYCTDGKAYLVDEYATAGEEIEFWTDKAHEFQDKYGKMVFWCDSARVEHIDHFVDHGIDARAADKNVMDGIECMGREIKQRSFIATRDPKNPHHLEEFFSEIYEYVWDPKSGKPVKEHDDSMDTTRYNLYNELVASNKNTAHVSSLGGVF